MKYQAYKSILRIKLISGLQYRVAALAGVSINIFWGLILVKILMLFYELGRHQEGGMTLAQGITYIWLAQCFIGMSSIQTDTEVYQKITSGDFAYELLRPLDLYTHWYMRAVALRLSNTILRSSAALIVCILLPKPYGIQPPVSMEALIATIFAFFCALLLSCSFSNIMSALLIRVELGQGITSLFYAIVTVLSGMLTPLSIFPDWLQPLLRLLPFAGLMDLPCSLYTGIIPVSQVLLVLFKQLFWTFMMILLGRYILTSGLRKTVIQGG